MKVKEAIEKFKEERDQIIPSGKGDEQLLYELMLDEVAYKVAARYKSTIKASKLVETIDEVVDWAVLIEKRLPLLEGTVKRVRKMLVVRIGKAFGNINVVEAAYINPFKTLISLQMIGEAVMANITSEIRNTVP